MRPKQITARSNQRAVGQSDSASIADAIGASCLLKIRSGCLPCRRWADGDSNILSADLRTFAVCLVDPATTPFSRHPARLLRCQRPLAGELSAAGDRGRTAAVRAGAEQQHHEYLPRRRFISGWPCQTCRIFARAGRMRQICSREERGAAVVACRVIPRSDRAETAPRGGTDNRIG